MIEVSDLATELSGEGPFTVFAPDNKAFAKVPNLADIIKNKVHLTKILRLHIMVDRLVRSGGLTDGQCPL